MPAPPPESTSQAAAEPIAASETPQVPEAAAPAGETAPAVSASAPEPVAHLSPAECAARLAALFPAMFGRPQPLPLKLRIQVDVQQRAPGVFTKRALSAFLQRYTTGTAYLKALLANPQRFDLDGNPAGDVAEEHRAAATAELARRRALHDARRAAERGAQRDAQREAQRAAQEEARREFQARQADHQARQDRAGLLRAFETSTLTRANFCVLKRVSEAELDALLVQARQERTERPPQAVAPQRPQPPRPQSPHRPGPDDRRPAGRKAGPRRPGPSTQPPR